MCPPLLSTPTHPPVHLFLIILHIHNVRGGPTQRGTVTLARLCCAAADAPPHTTSTAAAATAAAVGLEPQSLEAKLLGLLLLLEQ